MDDFFKQDHCDRCYGKLTGRTTSWFNKDTICLKCSIWEDKIIEQRDEPKSRLEGIGKIPDVPFEIKWGEEQKD